MLAYIDGPIPPASSGLGSHAASPTTANPLATMQSFCLRTGTCQLPFSLPLSSGFVESELLVPPVEPRLRDAEPDVHLVLALGEDPGVARGRDDLVKVDEAIVR